MTKLTTPASPSGGSTPPRTGLSHRGAASCRSGLEKLLDAPAIGL